MLKKNAVKFSLRNETTEVVVFFLVKTTLFYFLLDYFFKVYAGLTIEGGRLYSPFIAQHLDFISVFRRFLLWGGAHFATLIGYPSDYSDYFLVVRGGSRVHMIYSCLGLSIIAAYAAPVLAWPTRAAYKVIGLMAGIAIINALNMIRLGGLAVLYTTHHYGFFDYINHHDLFNIIMIVIVFAMFVVYTKYADIETVKRK